MICASCSGNLKDKFIMKIGEDYWHEKCLKCSMCGSLLKDRCYEKFGSVFCPSDYFRQFSKIRCFACGIGIAPTDMVFKLRSDVICHVQCQRCSVCAVTLQQGVEIGVDENGRRLLCQEHLSAAQKMAPMADLDQKQRQQQQQGRYLANKSNFHMEFSRIEGKMLKKDDYDFASVDAESGSNTVLSDPGAYKNQYDEIPEEQAIVDGAPSTRYIRRRGPRTTIRPSQLDMLNRIFGNTPKPSKHARAKLALETGLSMRVIQVWFQNRRSKERRLKHLCNRLREFEGSSNGNLRHDLGEGSDSLNPFICTLDEFAESDDNLLAENDQFESDDKN